MTVPLETPDGDRWVAVTGVAFGEGVVYALRDVTDERALEQARSDFVTTASHELRTPLAAVYGAARTLRRPDLDLGGEQRDQLLEIIETETERLTGIVSQILLAGQLEQGQVDVATRVTDLRALAESVLTSARLRAPANIELRLAENGSRALALADEDKLRQVLVNLLDNAIKYSPDGGEVTVELAGGAVRATITVRDVGLGIPGRRAGADLREVLSPRSRPDARRRRQRARALHLPRARLPHGRRPLRQIASRRGSRVHDRPPCGVVQPPGAREFPAVRGVKPGLNGHANHVQQREGGKGVLRGEQTAALEREQRLVEVLFRVGEAAAQERDLDEVVQLVTDEATALVGARLGALFYRRRDGAQADYRLCASSGAPPAAFDSLPRSAFEGGDVVRLDDAPCGRDPSRRVMPAWNLPVRSYLAVPLVARGEVAGGLVFGHEQAGMFDEEAEHLACGAATLAALAISRARTLESEREACAAAEERAKAALTLDHLGDGVLMLDPAGFVRVWNRAAGRITGLPASEILDQPIAAAVPGWETFASRVPMGSADDPGCPARAAARARRPGRSGSRSAASSSRTASSTPSGT